MATYQEIRQQVETLSIGEKLQLFQGLKAIVQQDAFPNSEVESAGELTIAEKLARRERVFLEGAVDSSERSVRKSALYQHWDERQHIRQNEHPFRCFN
jgi:predicted nuclease of restriction endonuclease-like RecB superfamily